MIAKAGQAVVRRNVAAGNPALTRRPGARTIESLARRPRCTVSARNGFLLRMLVMSAVLPPSHLIAQHVSRALAEDIYRALH